MDEPAAAPPVAAPASPNSRRIAILVLVVLLAIVILGVWSWVGFTQSPAYSLGQLTRAAAAKDWAGVRRYADVTSVARLAVDKAVAENLPNDQGLLGDAARQLAEQTKPALVATAVQAAKAAVESGRFASAGRAGPLTPLVVSRMVTSAKVSGDSARVKLTVPQRTGTPVRLDLRMKRTGDRWRVIEVVNSSEVLDRVSQ